MYPSDINDKEWAILTPFVVQGKMGRPRKHEIRSIINAIRYVMKSDYQWRLLPKEFPPWQTVMIINYVGVRTVNGKKCIIL